MSEDKQQKNVKHSNLNVQIQVAGSHVLWDYPDHVMSLVS